ncbi:MAG: hypothetical protein HOI50_01760 [Verrucomicrobia bacterium]|nr:hypothetical protein [Verrucomicrobiota bacterium]
MNRSNLDALHMIWDPRVMRIVFFLQTCLLIVFKYDSAAEELEPSISQSAMTILREECLSCHSAEKSKGGLNMESRESLLLGSDSGIVLVPEKPEESYLLETLPADSDSHMPPKAQLSASQTDTLRQWIAMGSPWDMETLNKIPEVKPEKWKLQPLPSEYVPVLAIAISEPNEAIISSQGRDLIVTRLENKKPRQTRLPTQHKDVIRSLTITPDHKQWVSGGFGYLNFWNIQSGQIERSISKPLKGRITALTFTADGSKLLVGESIPGVFGKIHIFREDSSVPEESWQAHHDELTSLQESRNGSFWMSASADHTVRIWESDTLLEVDWLEGHIAPIMELAQDTNGTLLISAGTDNAIKVWDQQSRERIYDLGRHQFGVMDLLWKTEKSELFALNQRGTIYRYQDLKVHTGAQSSNTGREKVINRTKQPGSCIGFWEQHDLLVMGTFEGELHAYSSEGKSAWITKPVQDDLKPLASQ